MKKLITHKVNNSMMSHPKRLNKILLSIIIIIILLLLLLLLLLSLCITDIILITNNIYIVP